MIFVCNSMRSISICVAFTSILHSLEAQSSIQHHHYSCMVDTCEQCIKRVDNWTKWTMRTCSARWDLSNDVSFMLCHSWRLEVREELTWQVEWDRQDWVTNQVTCHLPIHHQHGHIINDTSFDRSHRAEHVLIVHFVQLSTLLMHCSHITMHVVVVVLDWWLCFKWMENGGESNTYTDRSHRVAHEYHVLFTPFSILLLPC